MNIRTNKPNKNKFNLSREVKMTGNMGNLYPAFIQDVVPGDSFKVNTQQMVRFSPLLAPMMHRVDFKMDYFFVPYRLVWDEWKDFITGGEDGNDLPSYPRFKVDTAVKNNFLGKGDLADYMGLPVHVNNAPEGTAWTNNQGDTYLSALPFRAYQLIYHEYFRDQNVGTEYPQHTGSGILNWSQVGDTLEMRKSNWEKDYFTSALPFLQRGAEVTLPLGNTAPLTYDTQSSHLNATTIKYADGTAGTYSTGSLRTDPGSPYTGQQNDSLIGVSGSSNANVDITAHTFADLSQATSATINELRKASALQEWLELMARAGSRYREQIFAIFGERIPDYTVQVPQYLGGGKTPIMVSEVLSTYSSSANPASGGSIDRPMGDMAGHALGLGDGIGFRQSFDEHGIILGLARVIPKTAYTQGLNKFWQKFDKFDHYFPQFANLGEQEVYNKELYIKGDTSHDDQIFGYQQRYAEYKYAHNRIAGDFRDTLSFWELSRRFTETDTPVLNQSFIECDPDTRIFAIEDENEDKLWISLYHDVDAVRPIPYHSNPSLS